MVSTLETAARTAKQYFTHCDNVVITHDDENGFLLNVLYAIFDRELSEKVPIEKRIHDLQLRQAIESTPEGITVPQVIAPECIDLRHGSYVVIDGVYHAYLLVPSSGFNPHVVAGWTSLFVNAGEGIDVDFFSSVSPKSESNLSSASRFASIAAESKTPQIPIQILMTSKVPLNLAIS